MKNKFKEYFFTLIYYYETGKGRTIGRIYGTISGFLLILIFLEQRGISLSYFSITIIIILGFILVVFIGRWYIKKGLYKFERSIDNAQNHEIMQIKKDVEEIKKCLKD